MKPKRRIEDLAIGEYIYCETKKQAKKLFTPLRFDTVHAEKCWIGRNMVGFFWQTEEINSGTEYPASDFLPKKSKKASKKWVLEQISKTLKVTDAETVRRELEVGKWYKHLGLPNVMVYCGNNSDDNYGFDIEGVFENRIAAPKYAKCWKPASPEQVKSALIKEAERRYPAKSRVDSLGGAKDVPAYPYEFSFKYMPELNILRTSDDCLLFDNGKWAEIIEQPKEIDFSVPGQLLSCNNSTLVVMTSGNHESTTFSGFVISDYDSVQKYKIGHYSNDWSKSKFKPYTGEPIILKP